MSTRLLLCLALALGPAVDAVADDPLELAPGADAALGEGEGHLVLVFDTLNPLKNVRFTGSGKIFAKLVLARVPEGIHAFAWRAPAGEYCLDTFFASSLRYHRKREGAPGHCFVVHAGELTYPGHLAPRAAGRNEGIMHVERKPAEFLRRMRAQYPALLDAYDEIRDGRVVDDAGRGADLRHFAAGAKEAGETALMMRYYERAVALGSVDAMLDVAVMNFDGDGAPVDTSAGLAWLDRAIAAGDRRAAGWACEHLIYVANEFERARAYCETGAARDDPVALYLLAQMQARGLAGLKPDPVRQYQLNLRAMEGGNAAARYEVGVALRDGIGVAADLEVATQRLQEAFERRHGPAGRALGEMHERGLGVGKDLARAIELYQGAARYGDWLAWTSLGRLAAGGVGMARDLAAARDQLERGTRSGEPDAMAAYAWFLATCPEDALRDGRQALWQIRGAQAARATPSLDDDMIEAAALAELGNYQEAARIAQEAIKALGRRARPDDPRLARWSTQRDAYRARRAWRAESFGPP